MKTSYLCTIAYNTTGKIYEFHSTFAYLFILFKRSLFVQWKVLDA